MKKEIYKDMNIQESDVLKTLHSEPFINQRILAESSGHSLGVVNRSVKYLEQEGYLDSKMQLTKKAEEYIDKATPKQAVILAAGFGMRMVPINLESPKAFLKVRGEYLIERLIRQLHDVDIDKIYVVVGFMKEQFEYLIDEFGVELVVNPEYASKNNLHSLKRTTDHLANAYIVPCDIWCEKNPFDRTELYSWYMVNDLLCEESDVRVNRKMELVRTDHSVGNTMIGIAYLNADDGQVVADRVKNMCKHARYDDLFWEEALYNKDRMIIPAKVVRASDFVEINTYEQLRNFDNNSEHLKSDAISVIAEKLHAKEEEITDITVLKKGMTNRSFLFTCKGRKYIMRIPGEGTSQLISRKQEADVYHAISGKAICDDPIYINPENGYKITTFLDGVRTCDPLDDRDLIRCMCLLRKFHEMSLTVDHEFDLFKQIAYYESLWEGMSSSYRDYDTTKKNVLSLKTYIEAHADKKVLTHIDAVPDNFLFYKEGEEERLQLTDWEYAGMQDPHVDIAMFCIYSFYDRQQVDHLIDLYFEGKCDDATRIKIYSYIAVCGLLWSNWCEYKRKLGVEFGEYSLRQYRYAKEYFRIVQKALKD